MIWKNIMENCLALTYNLCIPEGWLEIIKISISIITIILAFRGLRNWEAQLKGTHQFELRKKIISLLTFIDQDLQSINNGLICLFMNKTPRTDFICAPGDIMQKFSDVTEKIWETKNLYLENKFWIRNKDLYVLLNELLGHVCRFHSYYSDFHFKILTEIQKNELHIDRNKILTEDSKRIQKILDKI